MVDLEKILFLDIETVPQYPSYMDMPENLRLLWDKKCSFIAPGKSPADVYPKAGIYAEFGKIITISFGFVKHNERHNTLIVSSFYDIDEKKILKKFSTLLNKYFSSENNFLCAHNGKEFDFPYIARRMLINDIQLPHLLDISGLKPWQVKHFDTLEMWRFGDYKHWTSLELLATIFNIPSPKTNMDGSDVYREFWLNNNLNKIADYCKKDVITLARLFLKMKQLPDFDDIEIK